jgi:hypothetical protein
MTKEKMMMATQTLQFCYNAVNPLVGLSSAALRLYSALEVFRGTSRTEQDWFRAPRLNKRLQQLGFSRKEIDRGFEELIKAGLLQMRDEGNIRWYRLQ